MREAYAALEAAEIAGGHFLHELERLEENFQRGTESYRAAKAMLHAFPGERSGGPGVSISAS